MDTNAKLGGEPEIPEEAVLSASSRRNSTETNETLQVDTNLKMAGKSDESSDNGETETSVVRIKKHIQRFNDSDSDSERNTRNVDPNEDTTKSLNKLITNTHSEDDSDTSIFKSMPQRSRIRKVSTSGAESESGKNIEDVPNKVALKNDKQQSRLKNKRSKIREKFKGLMNSRGKETELTKATDTQIDNEIDESGDTADEEAASIEKIKQKIKERTMHLKSTIYDPDTSDEESSAPKEIQKPKKQRKSTKLTSPKPIKMSAKQAMENMQKIRSESNRMLREKEVSLPYHRPKALTLKDIMNRRRPAVSSDGKALPIKMNQAQLKQYALSLQERQKEMIELCKSDTEDDEEQTPIDTNTHHTDINSGDVSQLSDKLYDDLVIPSNGNTCDISNTEKQIEEIELEDREINNTGQDVISSEKNVSSVELIDKNVKELTTSTELNTSELASLVNTNTEDSIQNLDTNEGNVSEEMELVYNDSVDEKMAYVSKNKSNVEEIVLQPMKTLTEPISTVGTEPESQLISLQYDTEKSEINTETDNKENSDVVQPSTSKIDMIEKDSSKDDDIIYNFSDDVINMDDIDNLIEIAETSASQTNGDIHSPMIIRDPQSLVLKPTLTGAPGMVIDLYSTDPFAPQQLSGVELLKQRFTYFAKLKNPEQFERAKEKKANPGLQHLKLKQQLEDEIAEQRSLEWAKRLEDDKQQKLELDALRGDDSDAEEDLDKIEAKLEENEKAVQKESSSESEEEEEEMELVDKPRKHNPMIDDEADESECDEIDDGENDGDDDESEDESSEESEDEQQNKSRKGRILKAFEDSDDEDASAKLKEVAVINGSSDTGFINVTPVAEENIITGSPVIKDTQDEELQLAQLHKSVSEDLFSTQESVLVASQKHQEQDNVSDDKELGTQTFSILNSSSKKDGVLDLQMPENMTVITETQPYDDNELDAVVDMCSGSFSQSIVPSQFPTTQNSQELGEDILALCTGKFYDNQFVSQLENKNTNTELIATEKSIGVIDKTENQKVNMDIELGTDVQKTQTNNKLQTTEDSQNTKDVNIDVKEKSKETKFFESILDELKDPEPQKPNKYFVGGNDKENKSKVANSQVKKRFVIHSDDEGGVSADASEGKKIKKFKKKTLEQRALQISDDEGDEQSYQEETEDYVSDIEDEDEKLVEYDSDENEVVVRPQNPKKKRKTVDFFEQEAELTSEDEWAGSGDEDEAGLDRMEREEGDDDTFHQGKLQRELGQIHMRDVLDQDKREVRLIQELLFEDGDLGEGHRQRKFRWRNADGEEETDGTQNELADTQEEEFESEELWRKERHERETFLKQMHKEEEHEDSSNVSINRSTIIKANLSSKTMSSLLMEVNVTTTAIDTPPAEKKTAKDIPSPTKPFAMFQQNFHGSLLTRGRGALARLAALATPLAGDDDAPKVGSIAPSGKRNFVFAALTPDEKPKVTKRKADTNEGTPKLVKKMRIEDKQKYPKTSLLDHIKT